MKKLYTQPTLEGTEQDTAPKEVTCLGITFKSDDERRDYFREELRKKLPELKQIEGYPIGEDDDIINLSDPPYYTACPNPWINDFIDEWENEKLALEKSGMRKPDSDFNITEPYASDVSEGKNNPIYNAHSYHTKVPHPAIMRYILHYTQPGDIVFDGFAGTGMTGVAAQMCGNPDDATKEKIEREWQDQNLGKPVWGARKAILGDLSPIASFIAYNYNTPVDTAKFQKEAQRILAEVEEECGWMYKTIIPMNANSGGDPIVEKLTKQLKECQSPEQIKELIEKNKRHFGKINYTVWSDIFICPNCSNEIIFWEAAVDKDEGKVKEEFNCYHCNSLLTKKKLDKAWETLYDKALDKTIRQTKSCIVMINATSNKKRTEKVADSFDIELIKKIEDLEIPYWYPKEELPYGYNTEQPKRSNGITHVHHFYTKRNLWVLSVLWRKRNNCKSLLFLISSINPRLATKMSVFRLGTGKSNLTSGTLYIPSFSAEYNLFDPLENKLKQILSKFTYIKEDSNCIETNSVLNIESLKDSIVDYIFTDPPFGSNIMYSELNFISEKWIKVSTNNQTEAIENKTQNKGFLEYQELMFQGFKEYYRILKPGKWMTVEFSNTSAAIWNGIQTALQKAGFVIANVAALDKQQGSFKAVTTPTAVKQDLIISCYKPGEDFIEKFNTESGEILVWDFIKEHLEHLPVNIYNENKSTAVVERSPKILYDRLISFYLMKNSYIPIDAGDFQRGLKQKFAERDGLYFTQEQSFIYDDVKAKMPVYLSNPGTYAVVIITNEREAVDWLRFRLEKEKQKYQDIMPDFRIASQSIPKGTILPELMDILEENFIKEEDGRWRTPDMNEIKDREILRNKVLLKEFNNYLQEIEKVKKLKEVRVEALRAGFKKCWETKEFQKIINLADRIPQNILLEDEQLLMYYDIARDKV